MCVPAMGALPLVRVHSLPPIMREPSTLELMSGRTRPINPLQGRSDRTSTIRSIRRAVRDPGFTSGRLVFWDILLASPP
jgi:hypothetical protein